MKRNHFLGDDKTCPWWHRQHGQKEKKSYLLRRTSLLPVLDQYTYPESFDLCDLHKSREYSRDSDGSGPIGFDQAETIVNSRLKENMRGGYPSLCPIWKPKFLQTDY